MFGRGAEPPAQVRKYYLCDCGHEVYHGDFYEEWRGEDGCVYSWEGENICPQCMERRLGEMTLKEKAALLGSEVRYLDDLPLRWEYC